MDAALRVWSHANMGETEVRHMLLLIANSTVVKLLMLTPLPR